jgi:steroid delta-isomerase-like uncharacterized protein
MADTGKIARAYFDSFNNRTFEKEKNNLVSADSSWTQVPTGETLRGVEGYVRGFQRWITAFPDGKCEIRNVIAGNGWATVEFRGHGTHKGSLESPMGTFAATGRTVDLDFCEVLEIHGGKITSSRLYYDAASMMRQLGQG